MNWNQLKWSRSVRQSHRWLSIVFTVAVIVNIVLNVVPLGRDDLVLWIGIATLLPLSLLLVTGLYLFVLPYADRRSSRQSSDA